ncbi:E3 ubiquitin-protein ligase RNF6-like [Panicum miliaceum]|uniref:E3 ubiquitin-protein ligase RNF6-like n=1 Tax=Panicum miliaceum TaxID=4540 RepID=A0A3L6RMW5_PANMI|nr:E3 ubiquitin-protein ligase RNF6-like [Panicum miliaceum]
MAGMLPGVECARRRRLRQGGSSSSGAAEAPPCGTRRPSFCLYAGAHDHAHLGSAAAASKERSSSVCKEMMARAWTLDTNAREAKERLDQKLRGQRESMVKRHQSTGTVRPPTTKPHPQATSTSGSSSNLHHSATTAAAAAAPEAAATPAASWVLQREVFSRPTNVGGAARLRRFSWSLLGRRRPPAPAEAEAEASECAVCLEELRAGDVLVHLPCAHRFHWSCGVPWVQAASRCPVCRALVHLSSCPPPN